jgi:hypothetical protein
VWAAAPGQAAVLYDGDRCLGGGTIVAPEVAAPSARGAGSGAQPDGAVAAA